MTRTRILYTGGTIGCTGTPLVPLAGAAFRRACAEAGLLTGSDWDWTDPPLDSAAMTPQTWGVLAGRVLARDGPVVVLHGTDTLAWSTAALALLTTQVAADGRAVARHRWPVVLTGAQRPLFGGDGVDPTSDAPANLALAQAAAGESTPGVRVAFGGRVLPGDGVAKVSTLDDMAFDCPNGAPQTPTLPVASRAALLAQLEGIAPHLGRRGVLTVTASPDATLARAVGGAVAALGEDLGAIHLLGYGLGTFPENDALAGLLAQARARGVLIALGSQVPRGPVAPQTYGAGDWLTRLGARATGAMTPATASARLHLTLALGALHGWDAEARETFFAAGAALAPSS
jgi:L-asparaginase